MKPHPSVMMLGGSRSPFTLQASPTSASVSAPYTGGNLTTNSVTVSQLVGPPGSTISSYAWSIVSGSGITATSPGSAASTFSGAPAGENQTISGTARCTCVNNFGQTATIDVPISIHAGLAALTVNPSPGSFGGSQASGTSFTHSHSVTVTTGTAPYTYSHSVQTGPGSVSPTSGSNTTTLTVPSQTVGLQTITNVVTNVTDSVGRTGAGESTFVINWT